MTRPGWRIDKVDADPSAEEIIAALFDRLGRVIPSRLGAGLPIEEAFRRERWERELEGDLLDRPGLASAIVDRLAHRLANVASIEEFRDVMNELGYRSARLAAVIDGAIVDPSPHVLYRLFNRNGILLYVGITDRGPRRWVEHERTKSWFASVARFEIERYPSRGELEEAERVAIQRGRPIYNMVHNSAASAG